jgi:hypothetical protein
MESRAGACRPEMAQQGLGADAVIDEQSRGVLPRSYEIAMKQRKQDPMSSEMLLLVLALAFCVIVGAVLMLLFRGVGIELFT